MPNQLTAQELEDWFAHPITELFFKHIDKAISDCHEDKRNSFVPENPHLTQERLAWLYGAEWAFGTLTDMRDEKLIGAVEDYEYIGH